MGIHAEVNIPLKALNCQTHTAFTMIEQLIISTQRQQLTVRCAHIKIIIPTVVKTIRCMNTYIHLIALSIASDNGLYFVPPPLALLSARVSLSKKCLLVCSRAELHSCTLRVIFVYGPQSNKQKILSQVQSSMCKHNDT